MFRNRRGIWQHNVALLMAVVLTTISGSAQADFTFGKPVNQTTTIPVLDAMYENPFCFSADGLEMYIVSYRPEAIGGCDIAVLRRDSTDAPWPVPEHLGPAVNGTTGANAPFLSQDRLELYFSADRPEGYGSGDLYVSVRATRDSPWGEAINLGPKVNSSSWEGFCGVSPDGLELYFQSDRPGGLGGFDFYVSKRATKHDPWGDPANLGAVVNSQVDEVGLYLSLDGLMLLFQDRGGSVPRSGGYGGGDLWMTRRVSLSAPWGPPVNLGPNVNGSHCECIPCISPDGSVLYWCTETEGVYENWQAPILPVVDFSADGKLDLTDLVMMIQNWGTDKTLYDIGPMPWADGKVDIEDLKVFMTEWEKADPPVKP